MSGASGVETKLSSKWARAMLKTMNNMFGHEDYENTETSCMWSVKAREFLGDKAKSADVMKLTYTDSTGYLKISIPNAENKTVVKNILTELVTWYAKKQSGETDVHYSELIEDIVEQLPEDGENEWWNEIRKSEVVHKTRASYARSMATVNSTAKIVGKRGSSSSGTGRVEVDETAGMILTKMAMDTWEVLQDYPEARDRVVRDLINTGANVKIEDGTISVKEDPTEDDW